MPQTPIQPANAILVGGTPLVQELTVEGTGIKPGRLVIKGTAAYQCKVGTAAAKHEVLGVVDVMPDVTRQTVTSGAKVTGPDNATAYTAGDQVRVLKGPIRVLLVLKSGETITVGERLMCDDNGVVVTSTGAVSGAVVADVASAVEGVTSTDQEWIICDLLI